MSRPPNDRDLSESERSFRLLVEGVVDYALYMLDPTGIITSWNVGGERIKGYSPSEIIGRHFAVFYTPNDQANGKPARALAIATERGRYDEEGWRVRKDGTFFWASVVIDAIREDGELIGFAKITRDITERREAQVRLEQMQRQLAEAQRLDALGQLTGGVAHDFNNLLMVVTGNLQILKRAIGPENTRAQRAIQSIDTASRRGASLTRQLLTFARRQSVNPESINIDERLSEIREVLLTAAGSGVALDIDVDQNVWPILVDVSELETALVNLVVNARDAMPDGGVITIRAFNRTVAGDSAGDFVAIVVEDEGVGIPPDILGKVFEPFFTTKPVGKGTGLGLSQVHGFTHQAGGSISMSSELGRGTEVTMTLPRAEPAVDTPPETISGEGTVLLVEDNPDVAAASTALLEQLGYAVRWAQDGEAALRELEDNGIDLVFSDIVMPGKIDGINLAKAIRAQRPHLPILLATGYADAARDVKAEFPILRKPFQIHELGQALSKFGRA